MEILFFIFIFIFEIKTDIINNPFNLGNGKYPFLLSSSYSRTNFLISSEKSYRINKEKGSIEKIDDKNSINYSSNSILIKDRSNNNYIYDKESNKYYKIEYRNEVDDFLYYNIISLATQMTIDKKMNIIGSIAQDNVFIIYGLIENKLFFTTQFQNIFCTLDIEGINDKISCKHIVEEDFICAIIINQSIQLFILKYHINKGDDNFQNGC